MVCKVQLKYVAVDKIQVCLLVWRALLKWELICMSDGEKEIVFVCVENARRSQMGAGLAETFGQGK
jgi:hypothetical protein